MRKTTGRGEEKSTMSKIGTGGKRCNHIRGRAINKAPYMW